MAAASLRLVMTISDGCGEGSEGGALTEEQERSALASPDRSPDRPVLISELQSTVRTHPSDLSAHSLRRWISWLFWASMLHGCVHERVRE